MSVAFSSVRRVEFADTDMAGLIHFTTFYRMMESVEHEFLRSLGTSVVQRNEAGHMVGWPRLAAECEFHAPAYFEDELQVTVRVASVGRSSLVLGYEFHRGELRIAHGRMKTVCCRVHESDGLSSVDIPAELRSRLDELVEPE